MKVENYTNIDNLKSGAQHILALWVFGCLIGWLVELGGLYWLCCLLFGQIVEEEKMKWMDGYTVQNYCQGSYFLNKVQR